MKILHFIEALNTERGGPVRAVLDLCHALVRAGHEPTIVTTELGPESIPQALRVLQITDGTPYTQRLARADLRTVRALLAEHEVLHVHGVWAYPNIQVTRIARSMNKPYIVSLRGMLDDWPMSQRRMKKVVFWRLFTRAMLSQSAAIHCTAQGELDQSKKWFGSGRGIVVPNLLNLTPFRNAPGAAQAHAAFPQLLDPRPKILFLSRIHYKKGCEVFVDAAGLATKRGADALYVIAGTGEETYVAGLRKAVEVLGLQDRVVWTGHVDGALKISLYQACQLFALPTSQENFGFVFPEALASGTPVVTTKGVDIWPELEQGGASRIVARTPQAFADVFVELVSHPEKLAALQARAKPSAFETFDDAAAAKRYEALYQNAIQTR